MSGMVVVVAAMFAAACGRVERPAERRAEPERVPLRETAQCLRDLDAQGIAYRRLPDKATGPGCGLYGTVQLLDIGVPVNNLTAVRCGAARAFSAWVRNAAVPAAYQIMGSELARVDTMGSYACRNVVGTAGIGNRRSGHALANAIDVSAFVLKDGRRISIVGDWNTPDPATRTFLQTVRRSACRRFGTVLSPDYNAAHRDHLHLEDDHAAFCR
ncbi:Extensin-like protein C-terminus [Sphingomonas gellani]|uniref:Extensin-like protein C-terminus n=1 Tax=Sphingomonas gellani TaxID=1166340 RepID=A0A1H8CLV9_9SPHN|nr:extensin family protein [Sphingomonas gellani]SEM95902.1 Extensin-like protein C-terminus [Sphingomonas gellani]